MNLFTEIYFVIFATLINLVSAVYHFGPQARIVSQDGHLILYAAEHKNISFQTYGRGGIHMNGIDLAKTAKISNNALEQIKKFQANFDNSFEKILRLEQILDSNEGLIEKVMTLQSTSRNTSEVSVNEPSVVRSVRKLNRRVNSLQRLMRTLTTLLTKDECISNPCKNGGTCQDMFNAFICNCPPEWEGPLCDQDVNECVRLTGTDLGCQNGATCVNRKGSYECLCPHGWFGLHCTRRSSDCRSGSNAELCGHGTCVTQFNDIGYKCICDQGWTTDGKNPACNTDINECAMNKPPCSVSPLVQCINLPGTFHCGSCPSGYSGNGYYCADIDECATGNGGCSVNPTVQCINTLGSRICGNCPSGYTGDGIVCSYQGICNVNNGGCHPMATCKSNPRISDTFVECVCPAGYAGNGIGSDGCVRTLQPISGPCVPNPCIHGICRLNGSDYTCICTRRYTGRNCQSFKNLCESNPCQNGGTCNSFLGRTFRCTCPSTHTGLRCEEEKQACGGRLESESGVLTFPSGHFQTYGHSISCAWIIETNATYVLNISFSRFNVEPSHNCQYDWLQIHDGKNTLAHSFGRFCGHDLPKGGVIISTHNIVYLWFRSDRSVTGEGFQLNWTSIVPFCGEELIVVSSHGIIQSPGAPGNYPNNRDCYWPLQAPLGKRLLFHFFTLMIGNDTKCDHDYLEFISGTVSTDPVFAKFCNTTHPSPLWSSGPEVLVHFHSDDSVNYPGFQITYSITEGIPGCGGVFTRPQGEIRSPSYNGNYPNDALCEYKIQVADRSRVKLTFLSFSLEDSEECRFDYVAIHAGANSDAPLIGKYCGGSIPSPYVSEDRNLFLVFKTDWATTESGFVLKYETVCGGKFTDSTGILESPGYPERYSHSLQCIYEVIQPLGKVIKLEISDLNLEENSYPECIYDFLEVRDGHNENSTLIGKYCERKPPLILSTYNYLWLKFETDTNNNGRGFRANYTSVKLGCGGILKETSGTFSSPHYPEVYPSDTGCKWIIAAPVGYVIQILWMNFQLEKSYDCTYDYVEIFDNNTETGAGVSIGKYCGQKNPPIILSTSNLVTITFRSDNTYNLGGFQATYSFIQESSICGGNYYVNAGVLKSPGYPKTYPLNVECGWTIQVQPGHQILLNVTDFELESYSSCRYDWLEIRNGGSAVSPLLGRYCGTNIPKLIPSHANKLYIQFKSDMTKASRGFKIIWEATATGCGGSLTSPTGSIISPNYPEPYNVNAECIWKISVSTGSVIQVVFSDLDLEDQSHCSLDYVELFDGPSLNSKSLGKYCSINPSFIRSTTRSLTVKFRSDISRNGRGFQLQYTTMCNNTLTGFRGVIESPNFPNSYPNSVNCNWEIQVAKRNKINITFSHFDLEKVIPSGNDTKSNNCVYDFVEIQYVKPVEEYEEEGPFEKYGVYCGDKIPPLITLNSDHVKIHFMSDNLLYGNGFRLEWQIHGCGDVLTRANGTITSPNYPKAYPPSVECDWKIQIDPGYHIEITFDKVELEKTYICHLDYIKLYNGEDDSYPEIANICHQNKPITVRSSGNFMFIKFKADASVQGIGFYANYSSQPTKCGGKYMADKANIMSPNYPKNYDENDTCGYIIEVGEGHMIELTFEDFDMYDPIQNCSFNNISYVKVYDGPSIDYAEMIKLCGKNKPNQTFISTTNFMYIEMVANTTLTAKGFLAKYRKSCGARIETEGSGIIRVDPNDLDYDETNCSWTIVSKDPTKHVSLTVTHLDTLNTYCDEHSKTLIIYNGETPDAPELGQYCGTKLPPTLTSDGEAIHVVINYNAVLYATYTVYDSACGGTLTSTEGYFASPGYPKKYPMETECEWTIAVEKGNHVTLSFIYFGLLESEKCNTDYLEIRQENGTGKILGIFCGNSLPRNITNMGSLWIFLKTSRMEGDISSITSKGFYAEYILNHNNELSGASGTIVSPLYSLPYPLYGDYSWKITVNYGKRILLTIKEIYLESGENMCFSEIDIYDGSDDDAPTFGEFCGSTPPSPIKTTSNVALIKFSGYSTTRSLTRFIIEWIEMDTRAESLQPKVKQCGSKEPINMYNLKNYTAIKSPGFPNGYEPNLNCEWIFTTISMNRLKLYFKEMDLQRSYGTTCYADYVEVFQKKADADWESVAKVCHENATSQPYIYTTNLMKVIFISDRYGNRTGFSAYIREDCGGTLAEPSGFIIYDNNTRIAYGNSYKKECQWNITVRAGKTIEIEVLELDIHQSGTKGCSNFLMFRNGKFSDSPILGNGKYCGIVQPFKLKTTSNNAYIKFSGLAGAADFKLSYHELSYECGGEISLNHFLNVTEISSPNYPNIPSPHIECMWRIIAPPGEILRIDFIDRFDLMSSTGCHKEYVELRDGGTVHSKLIERFCTAPDSKFSTDNMLFIKFFTDIPEPSNGFKSRISLATCGGTIRSKIGQIQSPFFNMVNNYPINVNCTWHLIAPPDHYMEIKFNKIDLDVAVNCTEVDHVTIYEPSEVDNTINIIGHYCGNKNPEYIRTSGSEAVVHFQTGKTQKLKRGFSLQFNTSLEECGGTLETSEGYVKSPGYPVPHKSYRRCQWYIIVPRGRRITLEIEDIDMNVRLRTSYVNGLSLYNYKGFKSHIITMSSLTPNRTIRSSDNTMFIFYWAQGNSGRGFKARFSSNEPSVCVGDFNKDSGVIKQPQGVTSYFCTYIRDKASLINTTVAITASTSTNGTDTLDCNYYYGFMKVTSGDEKTTLANICSPKSSIIVRSPFPKTTMKLVQHSYKAQVNFTVSYNTYPCGGFITGETGTITSPGFPHKYPKSLECSWQLKIPKEQTIQLTFNSLDLSTDCVLNYLDIYNGDSPTSPKIGRFCQNDLPDPIKSESNSLWIEYKYDKDSSAKGFSVQYEPLIGGCGGVFHDRTRIIQTPSYPKEYPNNAECLWELRSDEGYHIGLTFPSRFQLEDSDNCQNDFVEIWDWKNDDWFSLGKKCGRETPTSINSTSNKMKILFRSNDKISGQGFRAQWEWNCGGRFVADKTERFIVSPGYPLPYKNDVVCQYNITSNQTEFINIKFYHFDLEGRGSNCKYDNFTISNIWNRGTVRYYPLYKQTFCGQKNPPKVRLSSAIYIKFMTDEWVQKTGYKFSYQLDDCGGNIKSPSVITTPSMNTERTPGLYNGYLTCLWNVTAPPKKLVVIQFQQFNMAFTRNCYFHNVEIYNGPQLRVNKIANLCGNLNKDPPTVKSTNNSVIITLRTDRTMNQEGFKAEIYFADGPETGCGGRIDVNQSTILNSPNLVDMDCTWNIYTNVGNNIEFQFSELNLPISCGLKNHTLSNCSCSFLEIRDGNSPISEVMEKLCGLTSTTFGRKLTTSGNSASIRLFTRGLINRPFKINLKPILSLCGTALLNVTKNIQTFVFPGNSGRYPNNLRCTWMLRGSEKMVIHFVDFDLNEENDQHMTTNTCSGDKLQIVDEADNQFINDAFGPNVILTGNRRLTTDFSRYSITSGTYQFCGKSDVPFDYYSHVNTLTIKFISNSLEESHGKGFKFEYHSVGCNRNFTSLQGRIVNNVVTECFQTITVPENYTISLFFQHFIMYQTSSCDKVGIEVRDGSDKSATLLQQSCGYVLPNPVFSTKNKLWIHAWKTVATQLPSSYDLVYTSSHQGRGCGGTLYNYKGRFSSPLYPQGYKSSTPCVWNVRVPVGMRVAIKLSVFDIQGDCKTNYLKITTFEKEQHNDHIFCKNDDPAVLYSNSHVTVTYQSSSTNGGTGWLALYEAINY